MPADRDDNPTEASSTPSPYWLRRADQAAVAVAVLLGLGSMIAWWVAQGGLSGRLIEIEQAEPLEYRFQLDVNTAEWPELAQLPDVGPVLAGRIVESRENEGPYVDHEDLMRVKGIGPKTLEKIRPYLLPMPGGADLAGAR
jgi:competence protein ComEA